MNQRFGTILLSAALLTSTSFPTVAIAHPATDQNRSSLENVPFTNLESDPAIEEQNLRTEFREQRNAEQRVKNNR